MEIVPLSPTDVKNIYELLAALESTAAQLAAERNPSRRALSLMERAVETMDSLSPEADLPTWAKGDETFHQPLYELCGTPRLAQVARTIRDQEHRARMLILRLRPKPFGSNEEHKAVFNAILAADGERARELQRKHREAGKEIIWRLLAECRSAGI